MPPNFCPNCGIKIKADNSECCPKCGIKIGSKSPNTPTPPPPTIPIDSSSRIPPSSGKSGVIEEGIKKNWYNIAILLIGFVIVAAVFAYIVLGAGFFSPQTSQPTVITTIPTPVQATAPSGNAKYVAGDVIGKTASATENTKYIIIKFDISTDQYTRQLLYKNANGSWGHFINNHTETVERTLLEKVYPVKITNIPISSISISSQTSQPNVVTSVPTKQILTPIQTTIPTPTIPTPVRTPIPTQSTTKIQMTPGPTQTLPEAWYIEVQVQSNGFAPDPKIITTVRGGQGLNFIQQIDVRVTRSDGIVENGNIPKPLKVGSSVSLASTTAAGYVDRAEVWATTPQGDKVKIFDDYVPFRTYN